MLPDLSTNRNPVRDIHENAPSRAQNRPDSPSGPLSRPGGPPRAPGARKNGFTHPGNHGHLPCAPWQMDNIRRVCQLSPSPLPPPPCRLCL